jgi:transglutaminase-like putative cysteine protease
VPLLAVGAVALAATIGTLFLSLGPIAAHAALVAGVALLVLGGTGPRPVREGLFAGVGLLIVGMALLAASGGDRAGLLGWQSWTLHQPDGVRVGFVWEQSLRPLDFGEEEIPVLEVRDPSVGYLRVGTLGEFDGMRWKNNEQRVLVTDASSVTLPDAVLPAALKAGVVPVREIEIRNLGLVDPALPLPLGTVRVAGMNTDVRPVGVTDSGSVRVSEPFSIGSGYTIGVAATSITPALLNADLLTADADPTAAALRELLELPATGRNADQDGAAPWSRASDGERPVPSPEPEAVSTAGQPNRADVMVHDIAFPAFGEPGREQLVRTRIAEAFPIDLFATGSWWKAYQSARAETREATTPYQAAVLLENWFQREFAYDETASYISSIAGPLPSFVNSEARAGHCQYFAGAMAGLLRMMGIPARVAYGFAQGQEQGASRIVSNRDAHQWVEVHFPNAGWVSFEPTPNRSLAGSTSSSSPGFAASEAAMPQAGLEGLLLQGEDTAAGPNRGLPNGGPIQVADPAATDAGLSAWRVTAGVGALLAILLLILGAAVWSWKLIDGRRQLRTTDPGEIATAARDTVAGWLDDQRGPLTDATAEGVSETLRRRYGIDGTSWVDALVIARFGPPEDAQRSAVIARRETVQLQQRIRARLTRRDRVRGAVQPRRVMRQAVRRRPRDTV